MKRFVWILLVVCAVGLSVFLSAANLFLGDLNQDEGWYLYAAKQVAEGRMLYRDFMFTQGPGLPVVYGALFPIIGKWGVAGGRLDYDAVWAGRRRLCGVAGSDVLFQGIGNLRPLLRLC